MSSLLHLLTSHLFSVLGFLLGALLALHLLGERRPAQSTFAWLLAILLIPYIGVPLYLVFGGRKLARQQRLKGNLYGSPFAFRDDRATTRILCASGIPQPSPGNHLEWLETGEDAYAAVLETLRGATRAIHLSTLILGNDEVGNAILDLLVQRAKDGLEVRVLLDALFAPGAGRRLSALTRAGGKSALFMPVLHLPFRGHANLRLHRKIVVADGEVAIVGGMNLAREYMGPTPLPGRWRDLSARFRGPAVQQVDEIFRADWKFASGEVLGPTRRLSEGSAPVPEVVDPSRAGRVQVVGSGPDVASDLIYDAFLSAIFEAKQRLWLATPYFVPDEALARAILLAVRRGVDVRVLVPQKSNHRIADWAGASYLRDLSAAGGKVSQFAPGMMHAKVVIVDDDLACLGSANLDMRSLFLDYEIGLFFTSRAEVAALARWFEQTLAMSVTPVFGGDGPRLVESLARLVGPLV